MIDSRIPEFESPTFVGMRAWFKAMAKRGLLFHPADAPDQIISNITDRRLFSRDECLKLEPIISVMFNRFGDQVYEAAYPVFMAPFRTMRKR